MNSTSKWIAIVSMAAAALPAAANITTPPVTFLYADTSLNNASGFDTAVQNSLVAHGYSIPSGLSLLYKGTPSGEEGNVNLFNMSIANTPPPTGEQTATLDYTGPVSFP